MILLVEDDDTTREVTAATLRLEGHEVQTAANGHEALAALMRASPTVIVSDLRMPGLDGWTLRQMQLDSPTFRHIPFVVLSADVSVEEEGRRLGAVLTLAKPVDVGELVRCVRMFDGPGRGAP